MTPRTGPVLAAALLALGCAPADVTVAVNLRSDLAADRVDEVRTTLLDGTRVVHDATFATRGEPLLEGVRVAELEEVPTGDYVVRVDLLAQGAQVASQRLSLAVRESVVVTVLVTRDCAGVSCDDPAAPSCLGGACVASECVRDEGCEAECAADADCAPTAACASVTCVSGACLEVADDGACPTAAYCDLDTGCSDPSDGLVAFWTMEGGVDPLTDVSGNGRDATCAAADQCATSVPGVRGSAALFDGDDCYRVPHDPELATITDALTVAAYVRVDEPASTYRAIVAKPIGEGSGNTFVLFYFDVVDGMDRDELFWVVDWSSSAPRATAPRPAEEGFFHVAGRFDRGTLDLFVNGELVGSEETSPTLSWDTSPLLLGCDENGGTLTAGWRGALDGVRIYDRALSDREVAALARP